MQITAEVRQKVFLKHYKKADLRKLQEEFFESHHNSITAQIDYPDYVQSLNRLQETDLE
jgi:hypothetical protein